MTGDAFAVLADFSIDALTDVADADWTTRAGSFRVFVNSCSVSLQQV
jgi:hypothetical protein